MELRSGANDPGPSLGDHPRADDQNDALELARIETAYEARDRAAGASVYRFANPGYAFYMQSLERTVLAAVRRSPTQLDGANVLDVGCGGGYLTHRLVEFGAGAGTGVDLMPARIDAAQRRYPTLRFVCANAAQLPFADGEFDIVTQFTCLSSVLDPSLRERIAVEMWRVLRPGGIVLSYDLRTASWPVAGLRRLGAWRRRRNGQPSEEPVTPTTAITANELRRLFPVGSIQYTSVGLAFGLCPVAGRSDVVARLLAGVSALREHATGVVAKPAA